MPKTSNYENGLIYKFVCNDVNVPHIYVGSTTDWVKRKYGHKSACTNITNKSYEVYFYQVMRANGGWNNWSMLKICNFPCSSKFDLELEERRYIEDLHADLNKHIPTRTRKERYIEKRELLISHMKLYYQKHKQQITEERLLKIICECGEEYTIQNRARHFKTKKHCLFIASQVVSVDIV